MCIICQAIMASVSTENKSCEGKEILEVDITNPYASATNNLSTGLMFLYNSPLENVEKQLKELVTKQEFLITQIHNENLRLSEVRHSPDIQEVFVKLKTYHNKLLNIKKDIKLIYERSTKLKKRAQRLQQNKEKDSQQRDES